MADFGAVLKGLKQSKRYTRDSWEVNQFIFLVPGSVFITNREPLLGILGAGVEVRYKPHIDIGGYNSEVGKWTPTDEDLLADDWYEVPASEEESDDSQTFVETEADTSGFVS